MILPHSYVTYFSYYVPKKRTKCNRVLPCRIDSIHWRVGLPIEITAARASRFSPLCGGKSHRETRRGAFPAEVVEAEGLAINFLELWRPRPYSRKRRGKKTCFRGRRSARSDRASCVFARTPSNYCSRCERRILRVKAVRRNCTCLYAVLEVFGIVSKSVEIVQVYNTSPLCAIIAKFITFIPNYLFDSEFIFVRWFNLYNLFNWN